MTDRISECPSQFYRPQHPLAGVASVLRPLELGVERFRHPSRAGVFEVFFEALAPLGETARLMQMFDTAVVGAHVSAAGVKGAEPPGAGAAAVAVC